METVYSAESVLARPRDMLAAMRRDFAASWELGWRLLVRDLRARYRQSLLGFLWAFVPPLFMAAVLTFAADAKLLNAGTRGIPYPAYVVVGMTLWQLFTDALNAPIRAIADAKPLLSRVSFPREALVLAKLGEAAFEFVLKAALAAAVCLWFGVRFDLGALALLPAALGSLVLLGAFFGLLIAPFLLLYEDLRQGLALVTAVWFWATPVAYEAPGGLLSEVIRLNPVALPLAAARGLVLGPAAGLTPAFWVAAAAAAAGAFLAWTVFRLAMPFVIERLGA